MTKQDRKERLNNLCDSLVRSRMYDEANAYRDRVESFPLEKRNSKHAYKDFLAGWEAAMRVECEELLDENRELHGIVMDLCARLMVRRCDDCNGYGVLSDMTECVRCDGDGYIDLSGAEAVVQELRTEDQRREE